MRKDDSLQRPSVKRQNSVSQKSLPNSRFLSAPTGEVIPAPRRCDNLSSFGRSGKGHVNLSTLTLGVCVCVSVRVCVSVCLCVSVCVCVCVCACANACVLGRQKQSSSLSFSDVHSPPIGHSADVKRLSRRIESSLFYQSRRKTWASAPAAARPPFSICRASAAHATFSGKPPAQSLPDKMDYSCAPPTTPPPHLCDSPHAR